MNRTANRRTALALLVAAAALVGLGLAAIADAATRIHDPRPHNAVFDLVAVTELVATCPSDPPGAQCQILAGAVIHACDVEFDPGTNTFLLYGCLLADGFEAGPAN